MNLNFQIGDPEVVRDNFYKLQQKLSNLPDGPTTWGTILGTITDQTDLVSYVGAQTANGNTAFSWGNHAGLYSLLGHVHDAADITSGTLAQARGGTGFGTYATGDLLYASATNTLSKLSVGTNGHVLTLVSGVPAWAAAAGGSGWGLTGNAGTDGGTSNFIGTTDNKALEFRSNNVRGVHLAADGSVFIGNSISKSTAGAGYSMYFTAGGTGGCLAFTEPKPTNGYKFLQVSNQLYLGSNVHLTLGYSGLITINNGGLNCIGPLNASTGVYSSNVTINGALTLSNNPGPRYIKFTEPGVASSNCVLSHEIWSSGTGAISIRMNGATDIATGTQIIRFYKDGLGASIGTSTTQITCAILDVNSTTKGFLQPRMTTTQRNAIASPATGLQLYDTTINCWQGRNNSVWNNFAYADVAMSKVTAAAPYANDGYVEVNIGGTVYKLLTTA